MPNAKSCYLSLSLFRSYLLRSAREDDEDAASSVVSGIPSAAKGRSKQYNKSWSITTGNETKAALAVTRHDTSRSIAAANEKTPAKKGRRKREADDNEEIPTLQCVA